MSTIKSRLFYISILVCLSFILYIRFFELGFLLLDDHLYPANKHVRQGLTWGNFFWSFTTVYAEFWHPLTWLSLMFDTTLYGVTPAGYHFTNLLLHIGSTIFLFLAFDTMTKNRFRSFVFAALFALHPLHVEVVAWVAERKEVLCGFFWTAALYAYAQYAEVDRKPIKVWYGLMVTMFLFGLMSKSMIVTLPFTLLLLDVWPLQRWHWNRDIIGELVLEKIPLFFFSAIGIGLTIFAQQSGDGIVSLDAYSLSDRFANALVSYTKYTIKTFLPVNLSVYYPFRNNISGIEIISALVFLTSISVMAIGFTLKKKPYMLVGWCWFIGTLIPVIGIVKIGDFAMADRYMYMPIIGLLFAIVWLTADILGNQHKGQVAFFLLSSATLVLAGFGAKDYLVKWQNNETLFSHAAITSAPNFLAHNALGHFYINEGRISEAELHFQIAVSMRPDKQFLRMDLGRVLGFKGDFTKSIKQFQYVLQTNPGNFEAHYYTGLALLAQNKRAQAFRHFIFAVQDVSDVQKDVQNLQKLGDVTGGLLLLGINEETMSIKTSMARGYKYWLSRFSP